jgi:hypothetical protein
MSAAGISYLRVFASSREPKKIYFARRRKDAKGGR